MCCDCTGGVIALNGCLISSNWDVASLPRHVVAIDDVMVSDRLDTTSFRRGYVGGKLHGMESTGYPRASSSGQWDKNETWRGTKEYDIDKGGCLHRSKRSDSGSLRCLCPSTSERQQASKDFFTRFSGLCFLKDVLSWNQNLPKVFFRHFVSALLEHERSIVPSVTQMVLRDWNYKSLLLNTVQLRSTDSILPLWILTNTPVTILSYRAMKFRVLTVWSICHLTMVFNLG